MYPKTAHRFNNLVTFATKDVSERAVSGSPSPNSGGCGFRISYGSAEILVVHRTCSPCRLRFFGCEHLARPLL
jgi:hypothetical protein